MITISPAQISLSEKEFNQVYSILIKAYAITELQIWGENYTRISKTEYRELIAKNEIIFARIDNQIVGCIHYFKKDDSIYSFGLLAADFNKRGMGIGRTLINYVEKHSINKGALYMDLVILRAKNFEIENKVALKNWYQRLGYEYSSSHSFLEIEPKRIEKSKKLITPSLFDFYRKVLI